MKTVPGIVRRKCAGSGCTSVVLPEPVGPTMARLVPCGNAQVRVSWKTCLLELLPL